MLKPFFSIKSLSADLRDLFFALLRQIRKEEKECVVVVVFFKAAHMGNTAELEGNSAEFGSNTFHRFMVRFLENPLSVECIYY